MKRNKTTLLSLDSRVDRVLGLFSSRPIWDSPTPTRRRVCTPPLVRGRHTRLRGEGVGGPNSDEGTSTVVRLKNLKAGRGPY
jgi:hypothetical protein